MKRVIIPVAAFIAGMAIVPSVFAADNGMSYEKWDDKTAGLAQCLMGDANATCKLAGDIEVNNGFATITKNMTLDLNNHTLTIKKTDATDGVFNIKDDASLTIKGGSIVNEAAGAKVVTVQDGGSFTLEETASIEGANPVSANGATVTINGNLDGGSTTALAVWGKSTVAINGALTNDAAGKTYTYNQAGTTTSTIKGSIYNKNSYALYVAGGQATLDGANVKSADGVAFTINGPVAVDIKGCSEVIAAKSGAALLVGNGVKAKSLNIENSTLTSVKGNTIVGDNNGASIEDVTIKDSRFVAGKDKEVKAGSVNFVTATYNGHELEDDENILTEAKGSYGTLAAVCGGTATDEGEDKGEETENPNTADTIATYLTIATVALLGLGATAFVAKKSNR